MVLLLDDLSSLKTKIDQRAKSLFGAPQSGKAPLQVMRVLEKEGDRSYVENEDVSDESRLDELRDSLDDNLQVFSIRQRHTWTTLDISREFFEALMRTFNVFAPFWKCVFAFGMKTQDNEFEFPGAVRRRYRSIDAEGKVNYTHEFSYVMRRVEENGREANWWSVRQTAVYHKFAPATESRGQKEEGKSTFLMIAPSPNAEHQYKEYLEQSKSEYCEASVWNVHRILVADSIRGWGEYMTNLEYQFLAGSDRILMAEVDRTTGTLSPNESIVNFEDLQDLKSLEDSAMDLFVTLPKCLQTIKDIKTYCITCCTGVAVVDRAESELQAILHEFDEYIKEMEMYCAHAAALVTRAKATTQLLSDILSYEEAIAMKDLTVKARNESASMHMLAKRSTKDAAAVKILTVITLIYLPFTIVANFFSTEFVQTSDRGNIFLAPKFWLLFAISIPLTAVTLVAWWAWVHFARVVSTLPPKPMLAPMPGRSERLSSFRPILGARKKVEDPEK